MPILPRLLQAPMAGVSTPAMAAAVSSHGGLGGVAVGHLSPEQAEKTLAETRERLGRSDFNVNLFCHRPARVAPEVEEAWLSSLRPAFAVFDSSPPRALESPYKSLFEQPEMMRVLLGIKPRVVSFHFGLPEPEVVTALREAGITLLASATSLQEAKLAQEAGMHAVIAQGYEAGGHRGVFDPDGQDLRLSTAALTRLLVLRTDLPVVAAGGVMDGRGIASVLALGAISAQLGTAYVVSDESSADPAHKKALLGGPGDTVMTRAISGRPARSLCNRFTGLELPLHVPDYPRTYHAGKALNAAAKAKGESGFGAQWAGQGAPLSRAMPAGDLTALLLHELDCPTL